jgi:uncharacterized protein YegJ (DUF2314 family)
MTKPTVRYYHGSCYPKPDPRLHQIPKEQFLGACVKLKFPVTTHPRVGGEHMWVKVDALTAQGLSGTLENEPTQDVGYLYGDRIAFTVLDIEDVEAAFDWLLA